MGRASKIFIDTSAPPDPSLSSSDPRQKKPGTDYTDKRLSQIPDESQQKVLSAEEYLELAVKAGAITPKGRPLNRFDSFASITVIDDTLDAHISSSTRSRTTRPIGRWRLPSSRFRAYWETFNFLVYAGNCFLVPWRMVFNQRDTYVESDSIRILSLVIQCIFMSDVYLRLRKFVHEENGVLKTSPKKIFTHYLQKWFYIDFISCFPSYYLLRSLNLPKSSSSLILIFQMFRLTRYFNYWSFIDLYLTKRHIGTNSAIMEVSKVVILIMILVSVLASVLVRIGCGVYEDGVCRSENSWMYQMGIEGSDEFEQLNVAIYIVSQALYTVGYGDVLTSLTIGQRIFTTLMMLIGAFSFAVVIAVMSSVIANQDILYVEFRQNMEIMTEYMRFRGLKEELQRKLGNHFDYLFETQFGKLELQILDELPLALKTEVLLLNEYLISPHPFIESLNDPFFTGELIKVLIPRTYSPNEIVVMRGSGVHKDRQGMFFVRFGKIDIIHEQQTITSLLAGENFGSFEFLFNTLFSHTYKTGTFTELLVLEKDRFEGVLANPRFEDLKNDITRTISEMSKFMNLEIINDVTNFEKTQRGVRKSKSTNEFDDGDLDEINELLSSPNLSPAPSPVPMTRSTFHSPVTGNSPMPAHRTVVSSNPLYAKSPTSVFPKPLINLLRKSLKKHTLLNPKKSPTSTPPTSTRNFHTPPNETQWNIAVIKLVVTWLDHRNSVNEQISIFSKNMGRKKKFMDIMQSNDEEEMILLPDYFVLLSDSIYKLLFDSISFIFALYLSIAIPSRLYSLTKMEGGRSEGRWGVEIYVDYFVDAYFLIQIFMTARVFALTEINEQGRTLHITERSLILLKYYHSGYLTYDLLTFFPYDFLVYVLPSPLNSPSLIRLPKLLVAFKIPSYINRLNVHLKRYKFNITLDGILTINLFSATVLFTHWTSCIWAGFRVMHEEGEGENTEEKKDQYISAVYWALTTLTTVGFGDITPNTINERWFSVILMIIGSCFTAAVIANITSMAHKVVISEDNAQHVSTCVEKYMVEKSLPMDIRERCLRYFVMLRNDINEEKILRELLPPPFIPDIAMHVYSDVVRKNSCFGCCTKLPNNNADGLVRSITLLLKEEVVVEHDWILKDNPSHDRWYSVKTGKVHILDKVRGDILAIVHLNPNDPFALSSFGENALFDSAHHPSPYDAKAMTNCLLISLEPNSFLELESNYKPEFEAMREHLRLDNEHGDHRYSTGHANEDDNTHQVSEAIKKENNRFSALSGLSSMDLLAFQSAKSHRFQKLFNALRGKHAYGPESNFQLIWNTLIMFCVIYEMMILPFRLCFSGGPYGYFSFLVGLDYLSDIVFVVDSRFRYTGFSFLEGDTIVSDVSKIRKNYLNKGHKITDIISVVPIEVLSFAIPTSPLSTVQVFSLFRFLRILRLRHFSEQVRCTDFLFNRATSNKSKNTLKVSKLISLIVFCAHWIGSVWFLIAFLEQQNGMENWADCRSSIRLNHLFGCDDSTPNTPPTNQWSPIKDQYIRSLYWATTALTTAGYGDVSATTVIEEIFSIIVLVIGTLIFATVIANLEEIVAQVDVTSTLFQQSVDEVKAFMKMRFISDHTQEEIGKYHDTLWLKQKGASETAILGYLPSRVRHEVMKFHTFKSLKNAPIFKNCEVQFLNAVLGLLEGDFFLKDHEVWQKGECGFDMYFITRGNVDLFDGKNKLFSVGVGGLLGESEFFKREPRGTNAISSEYTTTFSLSRNRFQTLLDEDQAHKKIFEEGLINSAADFDVSIKVEKMRKNLKSGGKMATMLMLDDDIQEQKDTVFLPDSVERRFWDMLCMIVMIANFIIIPVRVAFFEDDRTGGIPEHGWFALNLFLDAFFWFDIFFNYKFFAIVFEGLLISDRHEFSELYQVGRLKWDLLACIPVDAIFFLAGFNSARLVSLLRLTRSIHILRFPYNIQSTIDFFEEHGIRAKAGIWHCARMVIFVLLVTHWCACTFYYIAFIQGLNNKYSWTAATILNETTVPMSEKYSSCLYWSMYTITLVGYGNITLQSNSEMVFSMMTMLIGTILCDAGITAILSSLIHQMDASAGQAQAWAQVITKYMRHRSLPLDLQDRIFGFFVHMHLSEDDLDEFKVLMQQPRFIKNKLLEEICIETMRNEFVPLMPFTEGLLKSVVHGMFPYLALPKEMLVAIGTPCDKVYVIVRGKVNVLTASRNKYLVTDTLSKGKVVGDFSDPTQTYRTISYCELYCLPLEHYSECFSYVGNNKEAALLDKQDRKKMALSQSKLRNGSFNSNVSFTTIFKLKSGALKRKLSFFPIFKEGDIFRNVWDCVCLNFSVYLAILVPLQAFVMDDYKYFSSHQDYLAINILDIMVDMFFVADIFLRCLSFDDFDAKHRDEDETLFWLYFDQTVFWVDIIATVPVEHFASVTRTSGVALFRLCKLLRIFRVPTYLRSLNDVMEERRILTHIGLQRMWNLFFLSAMAGHWAGSIFFYISMQDSETRAQQLGTTGSSTLSPTWVELDGLVSYNVSSVTLNLDRSLTEGYIRSLYWAYVTMITTGFGDITPSTTSETIVCIIAMYVGVLITCSAIANLTLLVSNFDQASINFHQKLDNVNKYLTYQQVPSNISNKIRQYYEYQWTILKGVDESLFLKELTPSLKQSFQDHVIRDYLHNVDVLRRAPESLITSLLQVNVMDKISLSPGDTLVSKGTMCKGLYILTQGLAEIIKSSGVKSIGFGLVDAGQAAKDVVESTMRKGEATFGYFLLVERPVPSTIKAKSYCEFLHMKREEFLTIVSKHCTKAEIEKMKTTGSTSLESAEKLKKFLGNHEEGVITGWRNRFLPGSTIRKRWDLMSALVSTFYCVEIPLHVASCYSELDVVFLIFCILFDLFWTIDTVLHKRYFPYRDAKSGLVVMDVSEITTNSKQPLLYTILMASTCVPLEFLVLGGFMNKEWLPIVRLLKVARLFQIGQRVAELENDYSEALKGVSNSTRRFVKLNMGMIIVCHFTGCIWYFIGSYSKEVLKTDNWINVDNTEYLSHDDIGGFSWYLRSFYFALVGMSTVGYGDIVPHSLSETIVAAVIILFGGLVLPAVVGGLASLMGNMNANLVQFRRKMDNLSSYMQEHRFPKPLQERIKNYYNYLWTQLGGKADGEHELADLPQSLKDELTSCTKGPILAQVDFLRNCNTELMKAIRASLMPQIFLPGDIIIKEGDYGQDMYLIERGKIFIMSGDKSVLFAVLERGDYFGESSLLQGEKRVATVVSPGYCDCLVLTKDAYDSILEEFPTQKDYLRRQIEKELGKKKRIDSAVEKNLHMHEKLTSAQSLEESGNMSVAIDSTWAHPDSKWRMGWEVLLLLVVLVYSFKVPFQVSFAYSIELWMFIPDYILDVIFFVDIWLNRNVFHYTDAGKVIVDQQEIITHYMKGQFKWDMFTSFPYDIIAAVIAVAGGKDTADVVTYIAWSRMPKMARMLRLKEYSNVIDRVLGEVGLSRGNAGVKLVKLLVTVLLMGHIAACFFFLMAEKGDGFESCESEDANDDIEMNWGSAFAECKWKGTWMQLQIDDDKVAGRGSSFEYYVRSFNWALPTLVVVVIGDVVPLTSNETVYCLLWMLVGVTINASIVGNIASIVANLETESSLFIKRADMLQDYLHQHGLPLQIQERSRKYLDWLWSERRGRNQDTMLFELPFTLRSEVTNLSRLKYVRSCEFFRELPDNLVEAIAMSFKSHLYSINDQIVSVGDESFELFYIEKGGVEVILSDNKTVCAKIDAGNFFGESALFKEGHRMANIRAADFCELLSLHRVDFHQIFKNHDDEQNKVLEIFEAMQTRNQKRNESVEDELKRKTQMLMKVAPHMSKKGMMVEGSEVGVHVGVLRAIEQMFCQHSIKRVAWEAFGLIGLLFLVIFTPLRLGFFTEVHTKFMEVDYFIDVYFVFDIIFRAFFFNNDVVAESAGVEGQFKQKTAVDVSFEQVKEGGVKTMFACEVESRREYRKKWMVLDILSSLPIDFLAIGEPDSDLAMWLRIIHLIRIFRFFDYIKNIESYLYHMRIRVSADFIQLGKVMLTYLLVNHFYACLWMMIHRFYERELASTWATLDGISKFDVSEGKHDICTDNDISRCYIRAFHFVITTISSVGYGDIYPATQAETMFEWLVVISGASLVASLIGSFVSFFQGQDSSGQSAFKTKLNHIQDYMAYKDLPVELCEKILVHHKHVYAQQKTIDVGTVMSDLPRPLQMEIAMFINRQIIHKIPLLRDCSVTIQKNIALVMKPQYVERYGFVYQQGDIGEDVYFILKGSVLIHQGTDMSKLDKKSKNAGRRQSVQNAVREGGTFGEDVVVSKTGVRNESARAVANTNLYTLSKEEIEGIMSMLGPEARVMFLERLLKREIKYSDDSASDSEEEEFDEDRVEQTLSRNFRKSRGIKYSDTGGIQSRTTIIARQIGGEILGEHAKILGPDGKSLQRAVARSPSPGGGCSRSTTPGNSPTRMENDVEEPRMSTPPKFGRRARFDSNAHETNLGSPSSVGVYNTSPVKVGHGRRKTSRMPKLMSAQSEKNFLLNDLGLNEEQVAERENRVRKRTAMIVQDTVPDNVKGLLVRKLLIKSSDSVVKDEEEEFKEEKEEKEEKTEEPVKEVKEQMEKTEEQVVEVKVETGVKVEEDNVAKKEEDVKVEEDVKKESGGE